MEETLLQTNEEIFQKTKISSPVFYNLISIQLPNSKENQ